MLKTHHISEDEINEFAHTFADYIYDSTEVGMTACFPDYPDNSRLINYLKAMIRTANNYNAIYSTSENHEGIVILTDTTHPYPNSAVFKMMFGMVKALGIKGFSDIVKKFQADGASIERIYRKEKKDFVQVELLAVKKEYQGQGFMRPLVETAEELADKRNLPLIITTDAILKKDKYLHLGMTLVNTRTIMPSCRLYDMERRPVISKD